MKILKFGQFERQNSLSNLKIDKPNFTCVLAYISSVELLSFPMIKKALSQLFLSPYECTWIGIAW